MGVKGSKERLSKQDIDFLKGSEKTNLFVFIYISFF